MKRDAKRQEKNLRYELSDTKMKSVVLVHGSHAARESAGVSGDEAAVLSVGYVRGGSVVRRRFDGEPLLRL